MKDRILELEKNLFKLEYMSNKEWLEKTIHKNFKECGKSGLFFNQKETIASLQACTEDRKIDIYNYEYECIDTNTYLIHYITRSEDALIYRTSIWLMQEDNLRLLFHQASKLNIAIELVKF